MPLHDESNVKPKLRPLSDMLSAKWLNLSLSSNLHYRLLEIAIVAAFHNIQLVVVLIPELLYIIDDGH